MERRKFVKSLGTGVALASGIALASCDQSNSKKNTPEATGNSSAAVHTKKKYRWKMVTTWPKNFPGLGTGANYLAETIQQMSNRRIEIKVYGAGELVPAMGVFDAVSKGTAEMGHGASYYWKGKSEAAQFFSAVPFGLNAQEMSAWINFGGGQKLWDEIYAEFNLKAFAAGNTGVQMGGWFNREINELNDYKGLKMRMPGLGAEILTRLGATPVSLPGGEIFSSLQSGAIDALEWVGPYNDLAFGFYKIAKYYYWPGWHEPGTVLECSLNKQVFDGLPSDLQAIITQAMKAAYHNMLSEFTARNNSALQQLLTTYNVQLKRFPDQVLKTVGELAEEVVAGVSKANPKSEKVYDSFIKFRKESTNWSRIGESGYNHARSLVVKSRP